MILVDSTVWIDFFADRKTVQVDYLSNAITQHIDLHLSGVILTEILQGIKNPKEYKQISSIFHSLSFLEMHRSTFELAAEIFATLRKRGITIRKTLDCMIAAVAIEYDVLLLHNDKDFDPIERYFNLRVIPLK